MEIGIFKAAFDGFAGQIHFVGQQPVAVAIVPTTEEGQFSVLLAGANEEVSFKIGHAKANKKSTLKVTLDSPLLAKPIEAEMSLKATKDGLYILQWER